MDRKPPERIERPAVSVGALLVTALIGAIGIATHLGQPMEDPETAVKQASLELRAGLGEPRFENARIVVRRGEDRAYVGFTIVGDSDIMYAPIDRISAVNREGRAIDWKHQTETGGPSEISVWDGERVVQPGTRTSGDADYFEASQVQIGETILVTFQFVSLPGIWDGVPLDSMEGPVVKVPFAVVAG